MPNIATMRQLYRNSRGFAVEDLMGVRQQEVEFCFYARIHDVTLLDKMAVEKEKHEQWKIKLDTELNASARIRLVDDRQYTMTTKIKRSGLPGMEEVNADIPKALFEHLRDLATTGYYKTRYKFPVPNSKLVWEIDVFFTPSGGLSNWVKMDLEVANLDQTIPETPFEVIEYIYADSKDMTAKEQRIADMLWNEEWAKIKRTPD